MSRKSFDDGHQNQAHTSGFNLDFNEMHNLFHGHREENVGQTGSQAIARGQELLNRDFLPGHGGAEEADDLGDLVDPQNDTYEEEGTHGLPLVAKAAAKGYMAARSNPKTGPLVKAGEEAVKEKGKEIVGQAIAKGKEKWGAKDELKGKGGAGLASPASESGDPFA
jgi:hypothetical protein